MIVSMTGYGLAECREGGVRYSVEIRSVNNRYFKASIKAPEALGRFEGEIEKQLRDKLSRGSVTFSLRVRSEDGVVGIGINQAALKAYVKALSEVAGERTTIDLASLLDVPGVCETPLADEAVLAQQFAIVQRATGQALDRLVEMRRVEGQSLLADLKVRCGEIKERSADIEKRWPLVVEDYHKKLRGRVAMLLEGANVQLDKDSLAREVAIFAERCDVSEELSRLASHLDQFRQLCDAPEEAGRKLDFLAQEMLREANTIGSKANDAVIARHVVEVKAAIDRIKEQVQNVE